MLWVSTQGIVRQSFRALCLAAIICAGCDGNSSDKVSDVNVVDRQVSELEPVFPDLSAGSVCEKSQKLKEFYETAPWAFHPAAYGVDGYPEFAIYKVEDDQGLDLELIQETASLESSKNPIDIMQWSGFWFLLTDSEDIRLALRCNPNGLYNECPDNRHREFIIDENPRQATDDALEFVGMPTPELQRRDEAKLICWEVEDRPAVVRSEQSYRNDLPYRYTVFGYTTEGIGINLDLLAVDISELNMGIFAHHYASIYELFIDENGRQKVRLTIQYFDLTDWQGIEPYYENELLYVDKAIYDIVWQPNGYELVLEKVFTSELPPWVSISEDDLPNTTFENCLLSSAVTAARSEEPVTRDLKVKCH